MATKNRPKPPAWTVRSTVGLFPGHGGWHFVWVDERQSKELRTLFGQPRRGWGSIPVTVRLGRSAWDTSIFYSVKDRRFLMGIKAAIRKTEGVTVGDRVRFTLSVREL